MTDHNVRPETGPSRESESQQPEEQVVREESADIEPSEWPVEGKAAGETVVAAPAAETVEAVGDEPAAPVDDAASAPGEPVVIDAEPVVTDRAEVEAGTDVKTYEVEGVTSAEAAPTASDDVQTVGHVEAPDAPAATEEAVPAPEPAAATVIPDERRDVFVWHPEHRGKTFDEVRAALAQDIAADQRQHRLAMDGAEESEQEALASVVSLERKWGPYDFDWAEQEPDDLADRIVEFERERERRREMISWSDYRYAAVPMDEAEAPGERPAELSTSAKGLSLLLVVLLIVVILLAVWAL